MNKSPIGKNIKKLLKQKNMTQTELADKVGITRGGMSAIVNGKYNPKHENLIKISKILNVRPRDLELDRSIKTIIDPNIKIIKLLKKLTKNGKIDWILQPQKEIGKRKKCYKSSFGSMNCTLCFSTSDYLINNIFLIINKDKQEIIYKEDCEFLYEDLLEIINIIEEKSFSNSTLFKIINDLKGMCEEEL